MIIIRNKKFEKSFKKIPQKIKEKTRLKFDIFKENPSSHELNNHKLK
jgi:hypothetical protein